MSGIERNYDLTDIDLGKGGFGKVTEIKKIGDKSYALKTQYVRRIKDLSEILSEIYIMHHLNHDNIIKLIDVYYYIYNYDDLIKTFIIMDKCDTDLANLIKSSEVNKYNYQGIISGLLNGLDYMHRIAQVIHSDLKPANILLIRNNDQYITKIGDLGMSSCIFYKDEHDNLVSKLAEDNNTTCDSLDFLTNNKCLRHDIITKWWRAPEICIIYLQDPWLYVNWYGTPVDCWSCGLIIYSILTFVSSKPRSSNPPKEIFQGSNSLKQCDMIFQNFKAPTSDEINAMTKDESLRRKVLNRYNGYTQDDYNWAWLDILNVKKIPYVYIDIIKDMLKLNPNERLTCKEALIKIEQPNMMVDSTAGIVKDIERNITDNYLIENKIPRRGRQIEFFKEIIRVIKNEIVTAEAAAAEAATPAAEAATPAAEHAAPTTSAAATPAALGIRRKLGSSRSMFGRNSRSMFGRNSRSIEIEPLATIGGKKKSKRRKSKRRKSKRKKFTKRRRAIKKTIKALLSQKLLKLK